VLNQFFPLNAANKSFIGQRVRLIRFRAKSVILSFFDIE